MTAPGPVCPSCGYGFTGLPAELCPECGVRVLRPRGPYQPLPTGAWIASTSLPIAALLLGYKQLASLFEAWTQFGAVSSTTEVIFGLFASIWLMMPVAPIPFLWIGVLKRKSVTLAMATCGLLLAPLIWLSNWWADDFDTLDITGITTSAVTALAAAYLFARILPIIEYQAGTFETTPGQSPDA